MEFYRAGTWLSLITPLTDGVVLGIDNVIFISILVDKLPRATVEGAQARIRLARLRLRAVRITG